MIGDDQRALQNEHDVQLIDDLQLLAVFIEGMLKPIIGGVDGSGPCSIGDALRSASAAAHLMFYVYRVQGQTFLHNQLFHDYMATVKNLFVTAARFQVSQKSV